MSEANEREEGDGMSKDSSDDCSDVTDDEQQHDSDVSSIEPLSLRQL